MNFLNNPDNLEIWSLVKGGLGSVSLILSLIMGL